MSRAAVLLQLLCAAGGIPAAGAQTAAAQPASGQCGKAPAARGLTVAAALGPAFWAGSAGRYAQPGPAMALALGYDLFDWLALATAWQSSLHGTSQPPPPAPGSFAVQQLLLELQPRLRLGRFDLALRGGIGLRWIHPNILVRVNDLGEGATLVWSAGAGVRWRTGLYRLWLGLEAWASADTGAGSVWVAGTLAIGHTWEL